ncbi:MBL fold metallo-hydrolase [Acetoanaerobium sticklandii]|uniref:MBL fold metallo-hydrolase n=1 Tax=Acetoanaerobium sticklandii TaxID=1511 RepID=UPI003A8F5074
MEITKIKGKSGFVKGGTTTGIYTFKDKSVLIIDPGLSSARGNRLSQMLEDSSLRARYCITTHEHLDHFEAYSSIKNHFTGCSFFCSENTKIFLQSPKFFTTYIYGANPHKKLLGNTKASIFDFDIEDTIKQGQFKLSDIKFQAYELNGHSNGDIGILSPDKVLYVGDALFDYHIMKKYDFPFIFDVEKYLKSLELIDEIDFDYCVIGHSKSIYNKDEITDIVSKNKDNVNRYVNEIYNLLEQPYTREELLSKIISDNDLKLDYKEYHYYYSTLGSMLTLLIDNDQIQYEVENGLVYYYKL